MVPRQESHDDVARTAVLSKIDLVHSDGRSQIGFIYLCLTDYSRRRVHHASSADVMTRQSCLMLG